MDPNIQRSQLNGSSPHGYFSMQDSVITRHRYSPPALLDSPQSSSSTATLLLGVSTRPDHNLLLTVCSSKPTTSFSGVWDGKTTSSSEVRDRRQPPSPEFETEKNPFCSFATYRASTQNRAPPMVCDNSSPILSDSLRA
jgi:hypothetical protein